MPTPSEAAFGLGKLQRYGQMHLCSEEVRSSSRYEKQWMTFPPKLRTRQPHAKPEISVVVEQRDVTGNCIMFCG